jgi:hypothetical protein
MNRLGRTAIAFTVGLSALAVAGWLVFGNAPAADAAMAPEWQPDFPAFANAHIYPMAEQGELNGQPFKLAYFTARATPEEVVRFYVAYWKEKGFLADGAGTTEGARATALDTRDGKLLTAAVRREGDRLTVFCSVMPSAHLASHVSLPIPDEALVKDTLRMDGAETVTYVVPGSVAEEQAHLTQRLGALGYSPVADRTRDTRKALLLEYENQGSVVQATLAREKEDRAVAVQLNASSMRVQAGPQP